MITIANFNSVLEIAFGLNALFYMFELVPHTEERLTRLFEKHNKLEQKKIELTKNYESFPFGFVISATYPFHKRVLSRLSKWLSLVVIMVLVYASFHPNAQIPTFWVWVLLVPAF